jgi:hypothetical protein
MPIALPEPYLEVRRVSRLEFETVENNTKIAFAQERPDCASTIGNGKSLLLPLRHRHPGYSRAKSLEEHLARHHTVGVLQALVVSGKVRRERNQLVRATGICEPHCGARRRLKANLRRRTKLSRFLSGRCKLGGYPNQFDCVVRQSHGAKRIVGGAGLVSGILCWVRLWKVSEVGVGEELYGLQRG